MDVQNAETGADPGEAFTRVMEEASATPLPAEEDDLNQPPDPHQEQPAKPMEFEMENGDPSFVKVQMAFRDSDAVYRERVQMEQAEWREWAMSDEGACVAEEVIEIIKPDILYSIDQEVLRGEADQTPKTIQRLQSTARIYHKDFLREHEKVGNLRKELAGKEKELEASWEAIKRDKDEIESLEKSSGYTVVRAEQIA